MESNRFERVCSLFCKLTVVICCVTALVSQAQSRHSTSQGYWQPLKHQPQISNIPFVYNSYNLAYPAGAAAPLLMTDGSVLIQDAYAYGVFDGRIFKLTPDIHGSYVNGTWSELASKRYASDGSAQAVLPDGRVLIEGAEY